MKLHRILPVAALMILAACNSKSETADKSADAADSVAVETIECEAETVAPADTVDVVLVATPTDNPEPAADKAVIMDFSATWCGPCQQFKPIYHKVAGEYVAKATFYSVDVDDCPELAKKYDVQSIPCVVILKMGAEPVAHVGYMDEAEFKAFVDKNI